MMDGSEDDECEGHGGGCIAQGNLGLRGGWVPSRARYLRGRIRKLI